MICSRCYNMCKNDVTYCPFCGNRLIRDNDKYFNTQEIPIIEKKLLTLKNKPKVNKSKVNKSKSKVKRLLIYVLLIMLILLMVSSVTICIYIRRVFDSTVPININLYSPDLSSSSYIYLVDKDGNESLVYSVEPSDIEPSDIEKSIPIDIEDVPQDVKNAFISATDKNFYSHNGVDLHNLFNGSVTITQRLVQSLIQDSYAKEPMLREKVKEIAYTLQIEKSNTKDDILETYLNSIDFGYVDEHQLSGIEAAAVTYFGKDTKDLDIAEAACLAAIPEDTSKYNPLTNSEENAVRKEYVLSKMFENGVISPEEYENALNEELVFTNSEEFARKNPDFKLFDKMDDEVEYDEDGNVIEKITPYYVDAAIYEVCEWIAETEGVSSDTALSIFNNGGYTLYLTIDLEMQEYVDEAYMNRNNFLTTEKNPQGEYVQSSFIAMDYDGNVLALAGGIGEKESNLELNRAVQAERQIGSTIKPVSSYGCALYSDKITWSTIFKDKGITVDGELWPKNYTTSGDSLNWSKSSVYVYDALRRSLNTIPAQICNELGLETVFAYSTENLGMDLLIPKDAPDGKGDMTYSALAVGSLYKGISIENLVNAFMPYGNGGYYNEAHVISRIENSTTGEVILDNTTSKHQVIDEETAYVMNKLLRQVVKSGTGTDANLSNKTVCAETGITFNFNDVTFVGLTEDFVSGVWVGYDTPYSLSPSLSPAKVWKNVIGGYADSLDTGAEYPECDTVIEAKFCTSTGKIATSRCPKSSEVGYYKSSNAEYCGTH